MHYGKDRHSGWKWPRDDILWDGCFIDGSGKVQNLPYVFNWVGITAPRECCMLQSRSSLQIVDVVGHYCTDSWNWTASLTLRHWILSNAVDRCQYTTCSAVFLWWIMCLWLWHLLFYTVLGNLFDSLTEDCCKVLKADSKRGFSILLCILIADIIIYGGCYAHRPLLL